MVNLVGMSGVRVVLVPLLELDCVEHLTATVVRMSRGWLSRVFPVATN